jgi:hypothetical protein
MPTLLQFAGYNKPFFSFGKSMSDTDGFALQFVNNQYQFIQYPYQMMYDGNRPFLKMDSTHIQDSAERMGMERKLKAVIQTYHNKLIQNKTRVITE